MSRTGGLPLRKKYAIIFLNLAVRSCHTEAEVSGCVKRKTGKQRVLLTGRAGYLKYRGCESTKPLRYINI